MSAIIFSVPLYCSPLFLNFLKKRRTFNFLLEIIDVLPNNSNWLSTYCLFKIVLDNDFMICREIPFSVIPNYLFLIEKILSNFFCVGD